MGFVADVCVSDQQLQILAAISGKGYHLPRTGRLITMASGAGSVAGRWAFLLNKKPRQCNLISIGSVLISPTGQPTFRP